MPFRIRWISASVLLLYDAGQITINEGRAGNRLPRGVAHAPIRGGGREEKPEQISHL
jgi:hypothetical protein